MSGPRGSRPLPVCRYRLKPRWPVLRRFFIVEATPRVAQPRRRGTRPVPDPAPVLAILRDRRVRMSELADYLGLDKSTISGLVDRAEKRGLLQRAPNAADGRATDVFLTAEGFQLADLGEAKIALSLSPMTGTLTRTETLRLTALLEHVLKQEGP
jgi:DNA-binding MarR family transcriptional regulator